MPRFLIAIISIFITLILGVVLVYPKYQEFKGIRQEIEDKNTELRNKEEYFTDLNENFLKLKNYEEALAKIDSALPENPSSPALLNFLEIQASQSGLVLQKVDLNISRKTEEDQKIIVIPVNLSLSGSYSSLKDFLSNLENNARLIDVVDISISPDPETELLEIKLSIQTYSY